MLAINLFALHHAGCCVDAEKVTAFNDQQLSGDEKQVRHLVMDLMAGSLSAYLLPVYTLKEGDALLDYFALPASKCVWLTLCTSI
jgi:protein SMG7